MIRGSWSKGVQAVRAGWRRRRLRTWAIIEGEGRGKGQNIHIAKARRRKAVQKKERRNTNVGWGKKKEVEDVKGVKSG